FICPNRVDDGVGKLLSITRRPEAPALELVRDEGGLEQDSGHARAGQDEKPRSAHATIYGIRIARFERGHGRALQEPRKARRTRRRQAIVELLQETLKIIARGNR